MKFRRENKAVTVIVPSSRRMKMDLLLVSTLTASLVFYYLLILYTSSSTDSINGELMESREEKSKAYLSQAESFGRRRLRQRIWQLYRQQLLIPLPDNRSPDELHDVAQVLYANAINETLPEHDQLLTLMAESEATLRTPTVEWHRAGLHRLTDFIQSRIHASQHPANCSQRRFLVCPYKNANGYGAEQHQIAHCLIVAAALGRTMLIKDDGRNWHLVRYNDSLWMINGGLDERGWSALFEPVSNCNTKDYLSENNSNSEVTYSAANHSTLSKESARVINVIKPANEIRVDQLPLAFPAELAIDLLTHHSFPPLFFVAQFRQYLFRGNEFLRRRLAEAIAAIPFHKGPIVGVQVRRTDKIIGEARSHPVDKYIYWVEAWFRVEEKRRQLEDYTASGERKASENASTSTVPLPRRVYVATDEVEVIVEMRSKYPHYEFYANEAAARDAKDKRYDMESIIETLIDVQLLAKCSYLVCTFSSQMCRLPFELMQVEASGGDMTEAAYALDDVYHFYWMHERKQVAIESHHRVKTAKATNNQTEMDLGDMLSMTYWSAQDQRWALWREGINMRTGEKGIYPRWKVEERWRIVPFPLFNRSTSGV